MIYDRKEREIRNTLRKLSQQRVALVLQPGDVWVIEKSVQDTEETDAALKTCIMRGWVETIEHALPTGQLQPDGTLPADRPLFDREKPMYRLTDSGWAIINRSHQFALLTIFLSVLTLIVALGSV